MMSSFDSIYISICMSILPTNPDSSSKVHYISTTQTHTHQRSAIKAIHTHTHTSLSNSSPENAAPSQASTPEHAPPTNTPRSPPRKTEGSNKARRTFRTPSTTPRTNSPPPRRTSRSKPDSREIRRRRHPPPWTRGPNCTPTGPRRRRTAVLPRGVRRGIPRRSLPTRAWRVSASRCGSRRGCRLP